MNTFTVSIQDYLKSDSPVDQAKGVVFCWFLGYISCEDGRRTGEDSQMHKIIVEKKDEIAAICLKYDVERLEIFGSAARGTDFDPLRSDVDFLVHYNPPLFPGLAQRHLDMILALEEALERDVDLVRIGTIRNPYRKASINEDRVLIYEK